jgi:thiol-disulfide isomerase/thioredoxin
VVSRAIAAAFFTAMIFLAGLSFGFFWDSLRTSESEREINELVVYSSALFLESRLIEDAGCDSLKPILDTAVVDLSEALERYENYVEESRFNMDSENLLYRRYLMSNLRYWFFAKEFQKKCGLNNTVVLFFFDRNCPDCDVMSERLTFLKKKFGSDILVFPINMDLAYRDPVAKTLENIYNVTSYPTLIINDVKFGYLSKDHLEDLVCDGTC